MLPTGFDESLAEMVSRPIFAVSAIALTIFQFGEFDQGAALAIFDLEIGERPIDGIKLSRGEGLAIRVERRAGQPALRDARMGRGAQVSSTSKPTKAMEMAPATSLKMIRLPMDFDPLEAFMRPSACGPRPA